MLSRRMFYPNPSDDDLTLLYHYYSENDYCAGWIDTPKGHIDSFKIWLRYVYKEAHDFDDVLRDCARDDLPLLRRLYDEALGDILDPDPDPAP